MIEFMQNNWGWIASLAGVICGCVAYFNTKMTAINEKVKAVKAGLQALLRSQMIDDYNHYMEKGYAPIYARENFENCWQQYHALGANGVMDDIHNKFTALPTKEE